jgi:hypothetical protein
MAYPTQLLEPIEKPRRGTCAMSTKEMRLFGRGASVAVVVIAVATACSDQPATDTPRAAAAPIVTTATTQRSTTSTTSRPPRRTIPSTTSSPFLADRYRFVDDCVEYFKTSAFLGDEESQAVWSWAGESDQGLREVCDDIAIHKPDWRATIESDHAELLELLASQPPPTSQPNSTTVVVRGLPPVVELDCGFPYAGDWEWFRMEFGYFYDADARIVEWGIDYGDGNTYVVDTDSEARVDLYWHKYWSDGSFNVRTWIVDEYGRRAADSCIFSWTRTRSVNRGGSDDNYYDTGGDLDCEDVGHEVYVGNDDPDNLDGDGDGWGCEGW